MNYKVCLVPVDDAKVPTNLGYAYVKAHKSEWVDLPPDTPDFVAAGWTQGVDFFVYNDKAYMMKKDYVLIEEKVSVILAIESDRGCDIV